MECTVENGTTESGMESENDSMEDDYYIEVDEEETPYDLESFTVKYFTTETAKDFLEQTVNAVSKNLNITPALAKMLLLVNNWEEEKVVSEYNNNLTNFLIASRAIPPEQLNDNENNNLHNQTNDFVCQICTCTTSVTESLNLECKHTFCRNCWTKQVEIKVAEGFSTEITCMAQKCDLLLPEDFALSLPISSNLKVQYQQFAFHNYVLAHPYLRFCVGPDCGTIFKAEEVLAKRVVCPQCNSMFCFKCGDNYHAPTDCVTIKNWLTKCRDDSETANYISAHTKDCPNCNVCIEKNGGCNHMRCYKCGFDFCWMCLGDWKAHSAGYYECSRYKENPDHVKARAALRKYLHYYERWQNHAKSLKLEQKTLEKIKNRISKKVMNGCGTWIDWQYLLRAASLLAQCRYTLQYTYPYAYYMNQDKKTLFEYQQAALEAEIENLSWKIERAETTDRTDIIRQMHVAENRRIALLKDFFQPNTVPQV